MSNHTGRCGCGELAYIDGLCYACWAEQQDEVEIDEEEQPS